MANKVGPLIKEARTAAGLTQEKLAAKIAGFSAQDLSKAERGELIPTNEQLKSIAKATGVTQKSLLDAAKASTTPKKTTSTAKTTTTTTKKTTSTAKKTTSTTAKTTSTPKTPANANTTMKVTATEKTLINAYRSADSNTKKAAMKVLKGEVNDKITSLLGGGTNTLADGLGDLLGDTLSSLFGGK